MKRLAMINSDGKSRPPLPDPEEISTDLVELRARVLARTPYDRLLTDLITVDAAETALASGAGAIYIDSFADYGLTAIRAVSACPVIGAGEAAIARAASLGPFSIVTVWPVSMRFLYDERLANSVGGDQCQGVHHFSTEEELDRVASPDGVRARMTRREDALVGRLAEACRAAKSADGSDVVLLGCTCMSPVAAQIQELCDFPVLNPSQIGQAAAFDALAGDHPARGVSSARGGEVSTLVDAWLAVRRDDGADDCDFCIATSELTASELTERDSRV